MNQNDESLPIDLKELDANRAKNWVYKIKQRFMMDLHTTHDAEGPRHEELFYSANHFTLPAAVVECLRLGPQSYATILPDGSMQLACTGAGRSKKRAELLAALDSLAQIQELGVDLHKPADVAALLKAREQQEYQNKVQKAQLLLELCSVSRPQFTTEPVPATGSMFSSTVSLYCRGRRLQAQGTPGPGKAHAQGNAILEAVKVHLPEVVGPQTVKQYEALIESAPANHAAALRIPRWPEDVRERLRRALGDAQDQIERFHALDVARTSFDEQIATRKQRHALKMDQRSSRDRERINQEMMQLETRRLDRAVQEPDSHVAKIKAIRDALPIKDIREDLVNGLRTQQVVVVSGGTGSGKSTQCPQYILEDAIANGKGYETRIVVTQPRRIAAISVAERIADERDERIGRSVGYAVRFRRESPRSIGGSIEFVTTGILLRRLINDPQLHGVSHVVIDEVHERDIDTDFLLVLLRDLLPKRPDLRVVLMSATLDADSFATYFSRHPADSNTRVPTMSVPPKPRHPVEVVHLEDFSADHSIPSDLQSCARSLLKFHDRQLQRELLEADAEEEAARKLQSRSKAEDDGRISMDSDSESDSDEEDPAHSAATAVSSRAETLRQALSTRVHAGSSSANRLNLPIDSKTDHREMAEITVELVSRLAQHLATVETQAGRKGSILCFLPGWDEIKQAMNILEKSSEFSHRENIILIPLHSTIPQDEQQKVFVPAQEGTVKVILATNIAESSVTIDDVLVVVDSGLVREMNYDPESVMSTMETVSISRASATQRLGRAGRVAPGKCYRLYSRGALQAMYERPTPEIQRTALEATCLQTCSMTSEGVSAFLQRAMDPPKEESVQHAMDRLVSLGAINVDPVRKDESLSPIGHCLSRLPLDPATGKMLIMGCLMKCLDPVLTAVACFSSRDVFYTPLERREEQRAVRQSLCDTSDLMASVRAYNKFHQVAEGESFHAAKRWAYDNFVSLSAMTSIQSVRSQLLSELLRIGLVSKDDLSDHRSKSMTLGNDAQVNENAHLEYLQVALWATGLPDSLAARRPLGNFGTLRTRMENHAGLHPSSVAFFRKPPQDRSLKLPAWFLYREMILSSQVFLRGCTAIEPEQMALFGGYALETRHSPDTINHGKPIYVLDDWILLDGPCYETIDLLYRTRQEIDTALELKVLEPGQELPDSSRDILDAVFDLYQWLDGETSLWKGEAQDDETAEAFW